MFAFGFLKRRAVQRTGFWVDRWLTSAAMCCTVTVFLLPVWKFCFPPEHSSVGDDHKMQYETQFFACQSSLWRLCSWTYRKCGGLADIHPMAPSSYNPVHSLSNNVYSSPIHNSQRMPLVNCRTFFLRCKHLTVNG